MENNIKSLSEYLEYISDNAKEKNLDIELIRYNFRMNEKNSYHFLVLKNKNPNQKEGINKFIDELNDNGIIIKSEINFEIPTNLNYSEFYSDKTVNWCDFCRCLFLEII